ncbi:hypothetical protein SprV_0602052600 [Sparganum proliferum]
MSVDNAATTNLRGHPLKLRTQQAIAGRAQVHLLCQSRAAPDRYSPHEIRHPDFISQFSCDIQHFHGKENAVTDALSRIKVDSVTKNAIYFTHMADAQRSDDELFRYHHEASSLILRDVPLSTETGTTTCDISTGA